MASYATTQDVIALYRPLTPEETQRVAVLLPIVIDSLRQEAHNVGKDLDQMVVDGELSASVVKSVAVDVVARTLMTPTDGRAYDADVTVCAWLFRQWDVSRPRRRPICQKIRAGTAGPAPPADWGD